MAVGSATGSHFEAPDAATRKDRWKPTLSVHPVADLERAADPVLREAHAREALHLPPVQSRAGFTCVRRPELWKELGAPLCNCFFPAAPRALSFVLGEVPNLSRNSAIQR